MSCHKLGAYCRILYAKKGKHWKESLMETFKMIFFAVHWSDTTHTNYKRLYIYIIAWWFYGEWVALAS